ncbi:MAG: hypothetical protein JXA44_07125 [Methanospirillaceae archaeon]|nr:hypothetical protein [Methanospirillaceae archaeon]
MVFSKNKLIFWIFVLIILFLITESVYAEYYSASKTCVNGCCTSSSEYSPRPYVPDWGVYPSIPQGGQYPGWPGTTYPTVSLSPFCLPYRQGTMGDYLCAGQYHTYCFATTGKRTYMEWILDAGCTRGTTPVMGFNPQLASWWRQQQCTADFDLYVYQNREPNPPEPADISDTMSGSNAYVGWFDPCENCYYCVVVYCKQGCGYYYLTTNSYVDMCWIGSGNTGISPESVEMYTGINIQPAISGGQTGSEPPYWVGNQPTSATGASTGQTQGTAPSVSGGQSGQTGYQGSVPSSPANQQTQGTSQPGYSPQAGTSGQQIQGSSQPGYSSQPGTSTQQPYSPPTAAGTSSSPEQPGEELPPAEEPWGPMYLISQPIQGEEQPPEEEPWTPQYTPEPTQESEEGQELEPGEEPWTPMIPYIAQINVTPSLNITPSSNITPNLTITSNITPDEEAWTPRYIYGFTPTEEEKDLEKEKNKWVW